MPVFLDIETTSRRADQGWIVAIGLLKAGEPEVKFAETAEEEKRVLEWLREELEGCDELVTWFGSGFDIPFLLARAALLDVDLRVLTEIRATDLCEWCRKHILLSSYRLESVANFFGIGRHFEFVGSDVPTLFKLARLGKHEARKLIVDHCKDDLLLLKQIHERVKP